MTNDTSGFNINHNNITKTSLYNQKVLSRQYINGLGQVTSTSGTLQLPKLITRVWANKLVGEPPIIKLNGVAIENIDYNKLVLPLLAYGTMFVTPFINSRDEFDFSVLNEDEIKQYLLKDDELNYLSFVKKHEYIVNGVKKATNIEYIYEMLDGVCVHTRTDTFNNQIVDGYNKTKISNNMFPFCERLKINADEIGSPIWWNASGLIMDCYKIFHDIMLNTDIQRPINAIPLYLTPRTNVSELVSRFSQFTHIPTNNEDDKWQTFGGNYNPAPYIQSMDVILNQISLLCGLGSKYLSFDRTNNAVRTAKEVSLNQNDLFINVNMVRQTLGNVLNKLITRYSLLVHNKEDNVNAEIIFEDGIFTSQEEYRQQLILDFNSGAISKEFYLSQIYPDVDFTEFQTKEVHKPEVINVLEENINGYSSSNS